MNSEYLNSTLAVLKIFFESASQKHLDKTIFDQQTNTVPIYGLWTIEVTNQPMTAFD